MALATSEIFLKTRLYGENNGLSDIFNVSVLGQVSKISRESPMKGRDVHGGCLKFAIHLKIFLILLFDIDIIIEIYCKSLETYSQIKFNLFFIIREIYYTIN